MNKELIGLCGPKGVGKTTFATSLINEGGTIFSLADPLKQMLGTLISKRYLYEDKEIPIPGYPEHITGRYLLQRVGTECFRKMWPDIWVNYLMVRVERAGGLCIVDDVRFPNEAEYIRSRGGQIWRLSRSGVVADDNHISEAGLPDHLVDKEIDLDGEA